jgi:hypothetical protein
VLVYSRRRYELKARPTHKVPFIVRFEELPGQEGGWHAVFAIEPARAYRAVMQAKIGTDPPIYGESAPGVPS